MRCASGILHLHEEMNGEECASWGSGYDVRIGCTFGNIPAVVRMLISVSYHIWYCGRCDVP